MSGDQVTVWGGGRITDSLTAEKNYSFHAEMGRIKKKPLHIGWHAKYFFANKWRIGGASALFSFGILSGAVEIDAPVHEVLGIAEFKVRN